MDTFYSSRCNSALNERRARQIKPMPARKTSYQCGRLEAIARLMNSTSDSRVIGKAAPTGRRRFADNARTLAHSSMSVSVCLR